MSRMFAKSKPQSPASFGIFPSPNPPNSNAENHMTRNPVGGFMHVIVLPLASAPLTPNDGAGVHVGGGLNPPMRSGGYGEFLAEFGKPLAAV